MRKENTQICNLLRFNTSDIGDKTRVKMITKYLLKDDICLDIKLVLTPLA